MSFQASFKYAPKTVKAPDTAHTVRLAAIGKGETRCPAHLGVIMTRRKKFGLGTNIINIVCPLCVQVNITSNKTNDADKVRRDLETLSNQYSELSSTSSTSCREINRLQSEIEALKEELAETKNVDALETDLLDRLVCKALPKIEEMIENADSGRDPPTSVEQIQELHANMMELEKKIKAVSDSAQQVVSDALHDVLEQINEVATQSNKNNFASESDAQAFRLELDEVQDDLHVVKRTLRGLPARVTRNEQQIKTVMNNLASLEDRMDRMTERYDRQFVDMDHRVSNLERAINSSPVVQQKVVSDDRVDGRGRKSSSEDLHAQLELLKLQKEVEELRHQNSQTQLTQNHTTNSAAEERFLWISNKEPLSSFVEDDADWHTEFLQLVNFDDVTTLDIVLTVVSESPDFSGGKLPRLITKMKESPGSPEIQLYGCVALTFCLVTGLLSNNFDASIAFAKSIARLDGVPLLVATLNRHQNNDRILFFSLNNLAIMAFASEKIALAIVAENCLDFAIATIRKRIDGDAKSNDRAIVVICIAFLFHTSLKSPVIRHSLIAKNGVEIVALVKNLDGLSKEANFWLNSLSDMLETPNFWWGTMLKAVFFLAKDA